MLRARSQNLRPVAAAALLGMLVAAPVEAQKAGGAKAFVQELGTSVIKDLTSKEISDSQRVKRLRELLATHFDVPAVGRFVLGVYYRQATDAQFQEFLKLYQIYVAHNYAGLFKNYSGETIEMLREQAVSDNTTLVFGRINQTSGPPVSMEIRVRRASETFKILDIKIEGVSMPLTHRKQFASVISRSGKGVAGLIGALRRATKRFEAETPSE